MPRKVSQNIEMLGIVAKGLKGLKHKVVFVGGATVDLFVVDPAAPATRATEDVDCVVEITKRVSYYALEEELRALGFQHPMGEPAPICRWKYSGIKVDVMPTEGAVLGFTNRWYPEGVANAKAVDLPNGERVSVFSAPYLLASKLEAFRGRGKNDYLASKDFEDIVALLDGYPNLEREVTAAADNLRKYLSEEFTLLLKDSRFELGLNGNLAGGAGGAERIARCLAISRRLADIS